MPVTGPRIGLSDRIHLGESATALIGPVDLPDLETVRRNLDAFASFGPATRIALRPDPDGRRWIHDPRRLLDTIEVVDEPADPLDLLVPDGRPNAPMRITLAGRYLRTDHEHGVGEIRFGLLAHQIITGAVSPQDPVMLAQISRRWDGLATAGLRVFGSRPTRVFDVLRSMRETKRTPAGPEFPIDAGAPATTPPPNLGPHTVAVAAMPADALGDLRAWRDATLPGTSLFALVVSGLTRALVRAGITVDDVGTLPVDLRRYLPRGTNPLANFVSGIQLPLRDGNDPARLHDDLTAAVASGRPIVSLARVTALSRAAQLLSPDNRHATMLPPKTPLVFTGIQAHQQLMDSFPWIDRDNSVYVTGTRPAVPNGITLQSATIHDRLLISASFQPELHSPERIREALTAFATDPAGVLHRPG
ncbi:hypothetical protein [Gordonia amarae]|uniref:hypothetical protein n=1 Tax=Gordonia amarae TaxID=36821 RepID=UPI001AFA9606|nr:hypothetical protein [Gordonia amarae]QHN22202.1 hypothetical protein GII34_12215 [Gordonia amarae]